MTLLQLVFAIIKILIMVGFVLNLAAILTWADRRQSSMIQDRIGQPDPEVLGRAHRRALQSGKDVPRRSAHLRLRLGAAGPQDRVAAVVADVETDHWPWAGLAEQLAQTRRKPEGREPL